MYNSKIRLALIGFLISLSSTLIILGCIIWLGPVMRVKNHIINGYIFNYSSIFPNLSFNLLFGIVLSFGMAYIYVWFDDFYRRIQSAGWNPSMIDHVLEMQVRMVSLMAGLNSLLSLDILVSSLLASK